MKKGKEKKVTSVKPLNSVLHLEFLRVPKKLLFCFWSVYRRCWKSVCMFSMKWKTTKYSDKVRMYYYEFFCCCCYCHSAVQISPASAPSCTIAIISWLASLPLVFLLVLQSTPYAATDFSQKLTWWDYFLASSSPLTLPKGQ